MSCGFGAIWKDILYDNALEELVCVRTISEVKCGIFRVLLAISRHCNDDRTWYRYWCRLNDNVSIRS